MVSDDPIMIVAGTRPEAIKLAPVIEWLDKLNTNYVFIWSGQHYDYEMSRVFFEQLGLPEPEEDLDIRSGSHAKQTARIMIKLDDVLDKYDPSITVAEGDTNTVVAVALTSVKKLVPFAHVEAGLRSWDRSMPEEINRVIADSIASIHFAPTKLAAINLLHEGIPLEKIHITGNTIVDVVLKYKEIARGKGRKLLDEFNVKDDYVLVTVHRQENTDSIIRLKKIVEALMEIARKHIVIFPAHLRTIKRLKMTGLYEVLSRNSNILLLRPLGYFEFLGLLMHSKVVLTDSGGVQEEACTLRVPTLTLRYNTERPETVIVGVNKLVGIEPATIVSELEYIIANYEELKKSLANKPNPLGDGNAGKRIAEILKHLQESSIGIESADTRSNPYVSYFLVERNDNRIPYSEITALYDFNGDPVVDLKHADRLVIRYPLRRTPKE